jgi:hypothetical protein
MVHIKVTREQVDGLAQRLDQAHLTPTDQTILAALIAAAAVDPLAEVEVEADSFKGQFEVSFTSGVPTDTVLKINKISRTSE